MSKFFAYLGTKTFRKNLIIAIASFVGFLIAIFIGLSFYTQHGEGMTVPKLKGMPVEEAISILESQGFTYQIDSVYQVNKSPGVVVEQDPDQGTNVKPGRSVYLTIITRLAPNVGFPEIVDMSFLEARAVLNNYGLKIGDTSYISDISRDRVVNVKFAGQLLRKGEMVPKGSKIDLVLGDGKGASEVDLPDLTGLSLTEAVFSIKGASLNIGTVMYEGPITDSLNARIIRQLPALSDSLTKVSIGTPINIVLSNP